MLREGGCNGRDVRVLPEDDVDLVDPVALTEVPVPQQDP
jgi:hypothetical protein